MKECWTIFPESFTSQPWAYIMQAAGLCNQFWKTAEFAYFWNDDACTFQVCSVNFSFLLLVHLQKFPKSQTSFFYLAMLTLARYFEMPYYWFSETSLFGWLILQIAVQHCCLPLPNNFFYTETRSLSSTWLYRWDFWNLPVWESLHNPKAFFRFTVSFSLRFLHRLKSQKCCWLESDGVSF